MHRDENTVLRWILWRQPCQRNNPVVVAVRLDHGANGRLPQLTTCCFTSTLYGATLMQERAHS